MRVWILEYHMDMCWDHVSTVCKYSKLIGEIFWQPDLFYHCYAEDIQVYVTTLPKEIWLDVSV